MKISFNWLKDFLPDLPQRADAAEAARVLTAVGLEVEGSERVGAELSGLLVAEVLAIKPHPSADKLRIVRVRAGKREEDVVCGAPNVPAPGGRVVWAAPGARLPGGVEIAARSIRGVTSPGMLVSEAELGLAPEGDGIIIMSTSANAALSDPGEPGADFTAVLGVADVIFEVNVTANRPDALSHVGVARELAGAFGIALRLPENPRAKTAPGKPSRQVSIADPAGCPRYHAGFVRDLSVAPSPFTMRRRLRSCGVRPISNLVDATNYILLELGHPLHAFDDDKLEGDVVVRRAKAGEGFATLDGVQRSLEAGDVVIADARGPIALAGVMGGERCEVGAGTRNLLVETATFDPVSVRRTARRLAMHSEASHRFERGVDPEGIPRAAERAAALLAAYGGGAVAGASVDLYPRPFSPRIVRLPMARLHRLSGKADLTVAAAHAALARVTTTVAVEKSGDAETLAATIPSFREDLRGPEDLVEEVLRLSGFETLPARALVENSVSRSNPEAPADRARDRLAAAGLSEIVSWAFVPRASLLSLAPDGGSPELTDGLVVRNPISADYEVMRTSLLPGLADAAARNLARGATDVALFEVGPVVRRRSNSSEVDAREAANEPTHAAGLLCGTTGGWLRPGPSVDFFDVKAIVIDLLAGFGRHDAECTAGSTPAFLHPGVSAVLRHAGRVLGCVGEIHPAVRRRLGLHVPAFFLEVNLDMLVLAADGTAAIRKVSPPRFPGSTRDVSFFVAAGVPAAEQEAAMRAAGEPLLAGVSVLEDFRDPDRVPSGKKGMLWTLTYRADDRTLTDPEADQAHARVVTALRARVAIEIR